MKKAESRQLENRQRGVAGFKPYRTMKWMKQGIKDRIHPDKPAKRERRSFLVSASECC